MAFLISFQMVYAYCFYMCWTSLFISTLSEQLMFVIYNQEILKINRNCVVIQTFIKYKGHIERVIVSKRASRKKYRNLRSRNWGDLYPNDDVANHLYNEDENISSKATELSSQGPGKGQHKNMTLEANREFSSEPDKEFSIEGVAAVESNREFSVVGNLNSEYTL